MTYSLGVDLGTTFVAAAVSRQSAAEMVTLSGQTVVAPALVYLRDDDTLVTGEAAQRRAITAPDRVGREFKRRLGDPTPVMLGGRSFTVASLLGALLRDVLTQVTDLEGAMPEQVALTYPANWGPYRRSLFGEVAGAAGLAEPMTITEPEAAAAHYAASRRLDEGQIVAVYDLGGGTFDATILRGGRAGVEILGRPEGIEHLGGIDFDESVLAYVNHELGGVLTALDLSDDATALALARLRQDCVQAKESLSVDTEATIPVFLPGKHSDVRLTRETFEGMIRASIEQTTEALLRTVRSADLEPADLHAVLLVGGSSRIPLIADMVSRELGCRTVVDAHPKYAVALGAASVAAREAAPSADRSLVYAVPYAGVSYGGAPAAVAAPPVGPPPARQPFDDSTVVLLPDAAGPTVPYQSDGHAEAVTAVNWPEQAAAPAGSPPPPPSAEAPSAASASPSPPTPTRSTGNRLGVLGVAAAVLLATAALGVAVWNAGRSTPPAAVPPAAEGPAAVTAAPTTTPAPAQPTSSATPTFAGIFNVAAAPESGTLTPDGKFAWFASTGTKAIDVIDLTTDTTAATIPIAEGPPQYVVFTPDGRFAYVSVYDELHNTGNSVEVIDTATRKEVRSIPAEKFPYAIAMSPNGRQVWVPNHDANIISVIDTASNAVVQKIAVKPNPHSVAFSVDGRRAYVANHVSNVVTVIDTKNGAILAEIPAGHSPHSIAMSPDGQHVYVVDYDGNTVTAIDPARNTVVATIPVGLEPQSLAFAPDSKHCYVVNDGSNNVSTIDTATNKVTSTVGVGQDPTNIFVGADGRGAYVTNISSNNVTVLNIGS